jgi:uncharacterized protein YoaH (UPF0181 family)
MKYYETMNVLEKIDYLMSEGMTEDEATEIVATESEGYEID